MKPLLHVWNVLVYCKVRNRRAEIRHEMMQRHCDFKKRGRGSKAWRRSELLVPRLWEDPDIRAKYTLAR